MSRDLWAFYIITASAVEAGEALRAVALVFSDFSDWCLVFSVKRVVVTV